ncbi:MAG TPA: Crp/Fnr family transcriptional regulator [Pseudolabrys sp.]|nr:Crp/Fnr family transcriptional regulator [Pseudolabrys sp.]
MSQSSNMLLDSVPAKTFAAIEPHLKTVELVHGEVLTEAGDEVTRVYFPHSGVISLVVELNIGDMIETAMVGRDGALNLSSALDGKVSLNKTIVQLAGAASTIEVDRLRKIVREFDAFRSLLIRHEQVLFAQSQQSAACNASHSVEARMCRWLLRMRDLAAADDLVLTQEFLAQMLGVRRPSVSLVANTLQKAGLVKYRRGNIRLLDVAGLNEGSCECYGTVKAHYDRMLST